MTYNKPALSIDKQIEHLLSCGMILPDIEQTRRDLLHKNYYRLRAYWLPFEVKKPIAIMAGSGIEHWLSP